MSVEFAKSLRKRMTQWEVRLWGRLRKNNLGVRFHRQEPVGKYIVDFICRQAWLIIEVDGEHHNYINNDLIRDEYLVSLGFKVMRFTNLQIQYDLNEVQNSIFTMLQCRLMQNIKPASRKNYFN